MKTKSMLFALILCLFTSLFCFACEADVDDSSSGNVHTHSYVEVAEVASTCVEQGTKAHYKCEGCEKLFLKEGEEYTEVAESDLKMALAAHTFDGIAVKTNPTKTVYTAFEQFDLTGIEVVKHCAVEGCAGEAVATEDVTFEYATKGAKALTADMPGVEIKAAGYSVNLALTVNKIKVALPTIASKEYTGSEQTADVTVDENTLYTVTENNGGTAIGLYDVVLTLKDAVNYEFEGVEGATATVMFEITKASNQITMPESIANITCDGTPVISATANEEAVISYVYSATEDGEYTATIEGGFVAGTYYVKAVAAETASYKETMSAAMSFTVEHAFNSWYTEDADVDTGVCVCGHELTEIVFNKKVTDARQDVILKDASGDKTAFAITLGGIEGTVKSVAYGELALGSDITALTVSTELVNATHGEQNLTIVVTDSYELDHTVLVPVTIVTESISTLDRLNEVVKYKKDDVGKKGEGKYYILANDITHSASYSSDIGAQANNAKRGFAGTLDGRGKTLSGGNFYGGGLFGVIDGGTVKNLNFTNVNPVGKNRTLIAASVHNATIENVRIKTYSVTVHPYDEPNSTFYYFGVIASGHSSKVTMKDVKIDMGNSDIPWILGKGAYNGDVNNFKCENVEITASSISCLSIDSSSGKMIYFDQVDGLKYHLNGKLTATEKIDPKEFGTNFEYVYNFEAPWLRYDTLKSVKIGGKDITSISELLCDKESDEIVSAMLVIYDLADYVDNTMYNKTAKIEVEFDVGDNSSVVVEIAAEVLDKNVHVTIERQDIILKDADGEKETFTLSLGEYADCTVTGIEFGETALAVNENGIVIPDTMKNGTHGENSVYVTAEKGNAIYRITAPVTIVTETFSTIERLLEVVKIPLDSVKPGKYLEGKYFTLADNIDAGQTKYNTTINGNNFGNIGINDGGFAGTLDGRGYTITGGVMNAGGIFGSLDHATIKNINFDQVIAWGANSVVLAGSAYYSTIEKVNITIRSSIDTIANPAYFFGVIAAFRSAKLTLTDVNITAENARLNKIFGSGWDSTASEYTCTNVVIKAKTVDCLVINSNGNTKVYEIPGVTVIESEPQTNA